jgi:hypothetical protein
MPESMADLEQLQSFFSAQPWRQGCMGILGFIFRTRAATAGKPATSAASKIAVNSRPVIVVSTISRGSSQDALSDDSSSNESECKFQAHSKPACGLSADSNQVGLSMAEEGRDIQQPSL